MNKQLQKLMAAALFLALANVPAHADSMKNLIDEQSVETYQVEYVTQGRSDIANVAAISEQQAIDTVVSQLNVPVKQIVSIKRFLK